MGGCVCFQGGWKWKCTDFRGGGQNLSAWRVYWKSIILPLEYHKLSILWSALIILPLLFVNLPNEDTDTEGKLHVCIYWTIRERSLIMGYGGRLFSRGWKFECTDFRGRHNFSTWKAWGGNLKHLFSSGCYQHAVRPASRTFSMLLYILCHKIKPKQIFKFKYFVQRLCTNWMM